jgi:hypothetical protein
VIASILTRALTAGLGCFAIAWGVATLPGAWRDHVIAGVAQRILVGEPFRRDDLLPLVPKLDAIEAERTCRPGALHSDAVIRLRIAESSLSSGDVDDLDQRLEGLDHALNRSLACSPSDPFLWLGLYWTRSTISGFNADDLKLLRMSYQLGPNEGWVMVKRNRLALAIFPSLPPDLAELALNEFAKLFEDRLVQVAADIFTGPGWPIRDKLLERIANAPQVQRQNFSDVLRARGVEVAVPGIVQKNRPWL